MKLVKEKLLLLLLTAWAEMQPRNSEKGIEDLLDGLAFPRQTGSPTAPFLTTVSCQPGNCKLKQKLFKNFYSVGSYCELHVNGFDQNY